MPISQSPLLLLSGFAFGTIFTFFGINVFLRPHNALSFFELYPSPPSPSLFSSSAEADLIIRALMPVYGARDIFMGIALLVPAFYKQRQVLGWMLIAASATAGVDGWVCYTVVGKGAEGHWGYAPMLAVAGALLLGVADGSAKVKST